MDLFYFLHLSLLYTHTHIDTQRTVLSGRPVPQSQHSAPSSTQSLASVHFGSCHFPIALLPTHAERATAALAQSHLT